MNISKILYSKTFPHPVNGQWEKIALEAEITPDENLRNSLYALKKEVENFHYESNKAAEKQIQKEQPLSEIGIAIADIYSCKNIKVLQAYEPFTKGKPELEAAYKQQTEKLSK